MFPIIMQLLLLALTMYPSRKSGMFSISEHVTVSIFLLKLAEILVVVTPRVFKIWGRAFLEHITKIASLGHGRPVKVQVIHQFDPFVVHIYIWLLPLVLDVLFSLTVDPVVETWNVLCRRTNNYVAILLFEVLQFVVPTHPLSIDSWEEISSFLRGVSATCQGIPVKSNCFKLGQPMRVKLFSTDFVHQFPLPTHPVPELLQLHFHIFPKRHKNMAIFILKLQQFIIHPIPQLLEPPCIIRLVRPR
mmetsp:Transcript_1430/g.2282  ORF Transcript_1430/g.2282 Transcript_1430/m.2282 type:complete len:246 (+) Transcript_1430:473-1210(+)